MRAIALITDLRGRGVKLGVRGDTLIIDAPKGVVAPCDMAALRDQKAEIIYLLSQRRDSRQSGPKADTPVAWRAWFQACVQQHLRLGRGRPLAQQMTWSESENLWHGRHGRKFDPATCAGCGGLLSGRERLPLSDGAFVHFDADAALDCLGTYGRRWRVEATAGLTALGLTPPHDQHERTEK